MLLAVAAPNSPPDTPQEDTDKFMAGFNGPFPTITGYAGTEISSTVSLLYQTDWDVDYVGRAAEDWSSKCIDMLYRASDSKAKVVNFMVTHFWVDNNFDGKVGNTKFAASVLVCVCVLAAVACSCAGHHNPVTAKRQWASSGAGNSMIKLRMHVQSSSATCPCMCISACACHATVQLLLCSLRFPQESISVLGVQVDYYCHKIRWGEGCPRINRLAIDRFRFGLQWCLAKAVEMVSAGSCGQVQTSANAPQ